MINDLQRGSPRTRSRRTLAAIGLALALSGCAAFDPHNVLGRQFARGGGMPVSPVPLPAPSGLSAAERSHAFDRVWSILAERYFDANLNGVDWVALGERYRPIALQAKDDDAYWDALDRMTGELRDAHTRVESPGQADLRRRHESISLGFSFLPIDERLVVASVHPESDAWWSGVRPGMSLVTIAGEPAAAAYQKLLAGTRNDSTERSRHRRAVRKLMSGAADTQVAFTFERADGSRFDATLKRRKISAPPSESHRPLPSGAGYIRFSEWSLGIMPKVADAIRELKDAPGIVIDLRGNPGGSLFVVSHVLKSFFREKTELGRTLTRDGRPVSLFFGALELVKEKQIVEGTSDAYSGPVAILVNEGSGSGSEYFAGAMQAVGRATVVGSPTCGCLMAFLGYASLPGGGELAYSEVGFVLANGKRIEGEGVIPDRNIAPTLRDLQLNRDRALEEAQALLGKN